MTHYELMLGWRYTRAKRRSRLVSFIALIAMMGIALGVAALIVVLSVMNGYQNEMRSLILSATSHVQVRTVGPPLAEWPALATLARQHPDVQDVAPYVEGDALFSSASASRPGLIRGIDLTLEPKVSGITQHLRSGALTDLKPGEFGIMLGKDLADMLATRVGESVVVTIPQDGTAATGSGPRSRAFRVVGLFEIGFQEADSRVALVHIKDAQMFYRMGEGITGLRVRLREMFAAPRVAAQWLNTFPGGLAIAEWTRQHANLFRAIAIQKRGLWIILSLVIAVAAFNVVSTLMMTVAEKKADIAILRTLGANQRSILSIFVLQGAIIGIVGTLIGTVLGVGIALNVEYIVPAIERLFGIAFIDKSVYQIDKLPSDLQWGDVWRVAAITLGLSLIAAIYPARNAARTHPAEALRYE
jgi:lipoprotein-releasing system permease protein